MTQLAGFLDVLLRGFGTVGLAAAVGGLVAAARGLTLIAAGAELVLRPIPGWIWAACMTTIGLILLVYRET